MKIELTDEELKTLKEIINEHYENSLFEGDFDEFQEFSNLPKKEFYNQLKIYKSIIKKLKK